MDLVALWHSSSVGRARLDDPIEQSSSRIHSALVMRNSHLRVHIRSFAVENDSGVVCSAGGDRGVRFPVQGLRGSCFPALLELLLRPSGRFEYRSCFYLVSMALRLRIQNSGVGSGVCSVAVAMVVVP